MNGALDVGPAGWDRHFDTNTGEAPW